MKNTRRLQSCSDDFNNSKIREEYIENHPDAIESFLFEVKEKYIDKMIESNQLCLFEKYGYKMKANNSEGVH